MDFIAILIGLGPLLGWGLFPTIASKFGGRPVNQIFGATALYFRSYRVQDGHLVKLLLLKRSN